MRAFVLVCGVMLCAGCGPSNPLLGTWKVKDGDTKGYCNQSMSFTSGEQTTTMATGGTNSIMVHYDVQPQNIYVIGDTNVPLAFKLVDKNTITTDTWAPCTYVRQ